jgi:DNA mismatch repair protein PMS2
VRFKEYGLKCIEVVDNGCGISPDDYSSIGLLNLPLSSYPTPHHQNTARKHHTSKLTTFSDLTSVLTYGFRGEALSSLCALSEEVSVATCTANGGGLGSRIEFDREGAVENVANIAKQVVP